MLSFEKGLQESKPYQLSQQLTTPLTAESLVVVGIPSSFTSYSLLITQS